MAKPTAMISGRLKLVAGFGCTDMNGAVPEPTAGEGAIGPFAAATASGSRSCHASTLTTGATGMR